MPVKVGINGFGRIGRNVVRAALNNPEIEFVAVNDLTDITTLAHLTKYDSLLGPLPEKVSIDGDSILIGPRRIKVFAEKDPGLIDWSSVGAEIVIESTGRFVDKANASKHLRGTVKKVIISAPAKDEDIRRITIRRSITSYPTLRAPRIASLPLSRFCRISSASKKVR